MVLRTWIVPEPDPNLRLTIDLIDPSKLNYDDIYWIHSSVMKKYREEFINLPGLYDRTMYVIREHKERGRIPISEISPPKILPPLKILPPKLPLRKCTPRREPSIELNENNSYKNKIKGLTKYGIFN
tara:strand:+ start:33 stop:413 length:381 start_codon:yes stop_codon:yes gene_type:complete